MEYKYALGVNNAESLNHAGAKSRQQAGHIYLSLSIYLARTDVWKLPLLPFMIHCLYLEGTFIRLPIQANYSV